MHFSMTFAALALFAMSLSIVSAAPTVRLDHQFACSQSQLPYFQGTGKPLPASKPKSLAERLADLHFRHRNRFKPVTRPLGTSGNIKEGPKMDEAGKLNARGDDKIPLRTFGIGQGIQPKKDIQRLIKLPEEVARQQREKVPKLKEIPPATARFSDRVKAVSLYWIGEVLFVTTGPAGTLVIQLAKLDGLKAIGSAGAEEKVQFMESLGADVAFNYKTTNTAAILSDAALIHAANHARFIITGQTAGYNSGDGLPIKNIGLIIYKQVNLYGNFILGLEEKYHEEFEREMPLLVKNGTLRYLEDVTKGLEKSGEAILPQPEGMNPGKSVVVAAEH
ncbi:hypothetical protein C8J56DRAFT_1119399 [Mycena floridula]|nr:hypothetical protein C8J56DRAFT_1119399 [Mycena floridula]